MSQLFAVNNFNCRLNEMLKETKLLCVEWKMTLTLFIVGWRELMATNKKNQINCLCSKSNSEKQFHYIRIITFEKNCV